jgi:hypothetical protein
MRKVGGGSIASDRMRVLLVSDGVCMMSCVRGRQCRLRLVFGTSGLNVSLMCPQLVPHGMKDSRRRCGAEPVLTFWLFMCTFRDILPPLCR